MAEEVMEQAAQPTTEESHESEVEVPTIESLQAELAKAKAESRKWEERAKKNKDAASRVADLEGEVDTSKSDLEKLQAQANEAMEELEKLREEKRRADAVRAIAKSVDVDEEILAMMAGSTEEEIKANADALKERMGTISKFPDVMDSGSNGGSVVTKESIMAIKNKNERFEAIKQNANLFR